MQLFFCVFYIDKTYPNLCFWAFNAIIKNNTTTKASAFPQHFPPNFTKAQKNIIFIIGNSNHSDSNRGESSQLYIAKEIRIVAISGLAGFTLNKIQSHEAGAQNLDPGNHDL